MAVGKREISRQLYLFSDNRGKQNGNKVVIDAHGARNGTKTFKVPAGITVFFYVPDGHTQETTITRWTDSAGTVARVDSSGVESIALGVVNAVETVTGGKDCKDYNLSKFVGYHAGGNGGMEYRDFTSFLTRNANAMDVATIRNRNFYAEISLAEAIDKMTKDGYGYAEVHCSFCRVPAQGGATGSTAIGKGNYY